MPTGRIVIIAGGDINEPHFYKKLFHESDYIICVNGGSANAIKIGVIPDLLVGDLDSLNKTVRKGILKSNPEIISHPPEKDKSDLELALDYATREKPSEIIIIGALGGERVEHFFINLLLLQVPLKNGINARIIDERHEICIAENSYEIAGKPGDYLSLFALTPEVKEIVTEGLKYPLQKGTLYFGSTLGLSNEFTNGTARITFASGMLLLIKHARCPLF